MEARLDFNPDAGKKKSCLATTKTARRQQEVDFQIQSLDSGVKMAAPIITSGGNL